MGCGNASPSRVPPSFGEPCEWGAEASSGPATVCQSGLACMDGICTMDCAGLAIGDACFNGAGVCSHGYLSSDTFLCRPKCTSSSDCPLWGSCDPMITAGGAMVCHDALPISSGCAEDVECYQGVCPAATRVCSASCVRDGCGAAQYCDDRIGCTSQLEFGEPCQTDAQCVSGLQCAAGWCTETCATPGKDCAGGAGVCGQKAVLRGEHSPPVVIANICFPACTTASACPMSGLEVCGPLDATAGNAVCYQTGESSSLFVCTEDTECNDGHCSRVDNESWGYCESPPCNCVIGNEACCSTTPSDACQCVTGDEYCCPSSASEDCDCIFGNEACCPVPTTNGCDCIFGNEACCPVPTTNDCDCFFGDEDCCPVPTTDDCDCFFGDEDCCPVPTTDDGDCTFGDEECDGW